VRGAGRSPLPCPNSALATSPITETVVRRRPAPGDRVLDRVLRTAWGRWLVPSLSDLLYISLIVWLFVAGGDGWKGLLLDGDAGWHIRTGEYILATGHVPHHDLFSFTKPNAPWFAWEWLTDVLFAFVHRHWALEGIVLLAGCVVALYGLVLLRHMMWRQVNMFIALGIGLLAIGASSIHFLARPHIFTLLLLAVGCWVVEADRRRPSRAVWLLVPMVVVWTNLHGGFLAFLVFLGILVAGSAVEALLGDRGRWKDTRRYGWLCALCAAASLVNPYGIQLHVHIVEYLRSTWIRNVVEEFQAPNFRSENLFQFEILLFLGLIAAAYLLKRRRITEALWIVAFAHMALNSVRHVPIFAAVAAPIIAAEASGWWSAWSSGRPAGSYFRIFDQMAADLAPAFRRSSVWCVLGVALIVLFGDSAQWPKDFPKVAFPVKMVHAHADLIASSRIFTVDQWADYLTYSFYPRQKVFVDGRSDFFGPKIGNQYLRALQANYDWRAILNEHRVNAVLAPPSWPLATALKTEPGWRLVADDGKSILFVRSAR
jgi:hypothetical protein